MDDVTINGGLMYEHYDTNGDYFSPRLGVNWRMDDQHAFRLVASKAHRLPSFFEGGAYYPYAWADNRNTVSLSGNPQVIIGSIDSLAAEKILAFEAGYFGTFFNDRLSLDLKLFRDELSGIIGTERGLAGFQPDTQVYVNKQDVRLQGAELEAEYRPNSATIFRLAYSYTDSSDPNHLSLPEGYEGVGRVPRHTLSALASVPLTGGFTGSAVFYHTSEMVWGGEGDEVPDSNRLDLVLDKTLRIGDSKAKLSFIVKNATDEEYREFRRENPAERTCYVQLRVDL